MNRDVVQPPVFGTPAPKKDTCFHLVTCWAVAPAGMSYARLAKHKKCDLPITWNVGPRSWVKYGFLPVLSAYATVFSSCSMVWAQSSQWHWWMLCSVACLASRDINYLSLQSHSNFKCLIFDSIIIWSEDSEPEMKSFPKTYIMLLTVTWGFWRDLFQPPFQVPVPGGASWQFTGNVALNQT